MKAQPNTSPTKDLTSIYLVELRTDHGKSYEVDTVAACSSIAKARAWIKETVKLKLLNTEFSQIYPSWFAICVQELDAPTKRFGLDSKILETYSTSGKNLKGNQPVYRPRKRKRTPIVYG